MRRQVRFIATGLALALLGVAVAFMPGCQKSYPYELRVVVRSAADGSPLAGVSVQTDAGRMSQQHEGPATTDVDGSFEATIAAPDSQFMSDKRPRWTLTLSRDGYADEAIDISPRRKPESSQPPTQIVIVAYMRPKAP